MKVPVIDLSEVETSIRVYPSDCPHLETHIKKIYGVWWSGEQSNEVIDELLVCDSCKSVIMTLSEERNNEVDYEY
jgi:hypothetical protein